MPAALSGDSSNARTMNAVPITPPVERKTPRMPVITAARSGKRSSNALLEDGAAKPMPMQGEEPEHGCTENEVVGIGRQERMAKDQAEVEHGLGRAQLLAAEQDQQRAGPDD